MPFQSCGGAWPARGRLLDLLLGGVVFGAGVVVAIDGFEAAEGEVGVDLGGGDIGVAEEELDAAQVGSVLDHVGGATVAEAVGAGGGIGGFDDVPDPLAGEGLAVERKEEADGVLAGGEDGGGFAGGADAG
jgi:hypothetical protein